MLISTIEVDFQFELLQITLWETPWVCFIMDAFKKLEKHR